MRPGNVYTAAEVMHRVRSPLYLYRTYFSKQELAIAEVFIGNLSKSGAGRWWPLVGFSKRRSICPRS